MIILKIILVIIIIAAAVGVIAAVADLLGKKSAHKPYGPYERFVKRGLDAFLATGALIVLSPVLLVTAILVRVKLGSPVLFTQERPGRDGKIFKLYKFRTMLPPKDGVIDPAQDAARLTPFGKKLRSTSLDELPELINIIKGDMAIVGPRPQLVRDMVFMTSEQRRRHTVRPGLTGLAQVNGRNNITWEQKFEYDLTYISKITFWGDLKIFIKTIFSVLKQSDTVREGTVSDMDFGDWLMMQGKVDQETYEKKQKEAKDLLGV